MPAKNPAKRKLSITADHSKITQVEEGPLKGLVRRTTHRKMSKEQFMVYSSSMALAKLLFPENFPKQMASGWPVDAKKGRESYSKRVELDEASNKLISSYYRFAGKGDIRFGRILLHPIKFGRTQKKLHIAIKELIAKTQEERKKFADAGIVVSRHPANIGYDKISGKPVFFEMCISNMNKLWEHILNLPVDTAEERLTKKQAVNLYFAIKCAYPLSDEINTHDPRQNKK